MFNRKQNKMNKIFITNIPCHIGPITSGSSSSPQEGKKIPDFPICHCNPNRSGNKQQGDGHRKERDHFHTKATLHIGVLKKTELCKTECCPL